MSVFHKFKKQAIDTGRIEIFKGSKEIFRDFIHIGDVCEILEKFLTVDATDIWNVGTGKANSFDYIAQLCAKKWNAKVYDDKIKYKDANFDTEYANEMFDMNVTILEITPEMKKAVQEGSQSLFEILGFATAGAATSKAVSDNIQNNIISNTTN